MSSSALRVLYIDDDRINTLLFVQVCKPDPRLEVQTAANGDDAMEAAIDMRPDVLVLDLHMPDTDGLQLLKRLRQIGDLAKVPAFLCTAERLEEVKDSAEKAGFAGVWTKPVQLATVQDDLSRVHALD